MGTLSIAGIALFTLGMGIVLVTSLVSIVRDIRDLGRERGP
jgi:hypothetical protein